MTPQTTDYASYTVMVGEDGQVHPEQPMPGEETWTIPAPDGTVRFYRAETFTFRPGLTWQVVVWMARVQLDLLGQRP